MERVEDRLHAVVARRRTRDGPGHLVADGLDPVLQERAARRLAASEVLDRLERIRLTRELQAIGFTLTDAVDALAAHDAGGATCESERWRLQAVLDRVDARLAELGALRGRIVQAQQACADGRCLFSRG